MSGNNILIDPNIALHLFSGNKTIAEALEGATIHVSFITEMELLGFPLISIKEQNQVKNFLSECIVLDLNNDIKTKAIYLRKKYKLKLPDAIIAASSIYLDIPLFPADSGMKKVKELNLAFFEEK
ncbi:MAG: type II toxin-antitoxin system VapC family toxin [Bacteroidota bacterium]